MIHSHIAHQVRELNVRRTDLDVAGVEEELIKSGVNFGPREHGTQAMMCASAAEGDVRVGVASDLESHGFIEHILIAVGRPQHGDDTCSSLDGLFAQGHVFGGTANPEHDRRRVADDLVGGRTAHRRIAAIPLDLILVGDKGPDAVA